MKSCFDVKFGGRPDGLIVQWPGEEPRLYQEENDFGELQSAAVRSTLEELVWPGPDPIPDNVLAASCRRTFMITNIVANPEEAVPYARALFDLCPEGYWAAKAGKVDLSQFTTEDRAKMDSYPDRWPGGLPVGNLRVFGPVDQARIELVEGWARVLHTDDDYDFRVDEPTFAQFEAAQKQLVFKKVLDDGSFLLENGTTVSNEDMLLQLKFFLETAPGGAVDMDDEHRPSQEEIAEAEKALETIAFLPSTWRGAMGEFASRHAVEVRRAPYGPALFVWSDDGKRLLRISLEEIIERDNEDLARIMVWLESEFGYDHAIPYEDGDTHILLWPEPDVCEGARHIPDFLLPGETIESPRAIRMFVGQHQDPIREIDNEDVTIEDGDGIVGVRFPGGGLSVSDEGLVTFSRDDEIGKCEAAVQITTEIPWDTGQSLVDALIGGDWPKVWTWLHSADYWGYRVVSSQINYDYYKFREVKQVVGRENREHLSEASGDFDDCEVREDNGATVVTFNDGILQAKNTGDIQLARRYSWGQLLMEFRPTMKADSLSEFIFDDLLGDLVNPEEEVLIRKTWPLIFESDGYFLASKKEIEEAE